MEWEEEDEEDERAAYIEEACAWGGSVIVQLGGCGLMSEDVEMEDGSGNIEITSDSGLRRTIVKPEAFKGMKVQETEHVGQNFRADTGAHIPNQGETTIV